MCTHNLDEADRLCDRIGVFKTRLLIVDTPTNLRSSIFGRKIVFHLQSVSNELLNCIRKFYFIKDAKAIENKIIVTLDDPDTQNPELIRTLIDNGANLRFVGELRHSLEEVYLELVQKAE